MDKPVMVNAPPLPFPDPELPGPELPGPELPGPELRGLMLGLNNAHAEQTSPLDACRLGRMLDRAFMVGTTGALDAFLIAFDQDADYNSANFLWLRARHRRFVYVDRIVTAPEARGRGNAARLYEALFDRARAAGHDQVLCEVNRHPPNPGSDAFHARMGFDEIGRAKRPGGKVVRYLRRPL